MGKQYSEAGSKILSVDHVAKLLKLGLKRDGECPFCKLLHNPEISNCNDPVTGALIRRRGLIVVGAPDKGTEDSSSSTEGRATPLREGPRGSIPRLSKSDAAQTVSDERGQVAGSENQSSPAQILRQRAEKRWPAKDGHKAGCCGYYDLSECPCQNERWAPSSAGNYPRNPNPPMREVDPRDRL